MDTKLTNVLKIAKPPTYEWFSGLDDFLIQAGYRLVINSSNYASYERGDFLKKLETIIVTSGALKYSKETWNGCSYIADKTEPLCITTNIDLYMMIGILHIVDALDAAKVCLNQLKIMVVEEAKKGSTCINERCPPSPCAENWHNPQPFANFS